MDRSDLTLVAASCATVLAGCAVIDGFGDLEPPRDHGATSSGEGPTTGAGLAGSTSAGGGDGGAGGEDPGTGGGGEDPGSGGGGGEPSGDLLEDALWVVPVPALQANCRHVVTDVLRSAPFTYASGVTITTTGEPCTIPLGPQPFTFSIAWAGAGFSWVAQIDSGGSVLALRHISSVTPHDDVVVGGASLDVRPALLTNPVSPWMAMTGNAGRGIEVLTAEPYVGTNIVASDGGSATVTDVFVADSSVYVTGVIHSPEPVSINCFDLPQDGPVVATPTGFLARFRYLDGGLSSCDFTLLDEQTVVWAGRGAAEGPSLLGVEGSVAASGACPATEGMSLLAVAGSPYACQSVVEELGEVPGGPGFPLRLDRRGSHDVLALRSEAGAELRQRTAPGPFITTSIESGGAFELRDVVASVLDRSAIVGSREGSLQVGGRQLGAVGGSDGFLTLVDPAGEPLSVVEFGVAGDDVVTAVSEDAERLVVAGRADGPVELPFLDVPLAGAWIAAFPPPP